MLYLLDVQYVYVSSHEVSGCCLCLVYKTTHWNSV